MLKITTLLQNIFKKILDIQGVGSYYISMKKRSICCNADLIKKYHKNNLITYEPKTKFENSYIWDGMYWKDGGDPLGDIKKSYLNYTLTTKFSY